jgi:hypothetical protein
VECTENNWGIQHRGELYRPENSTLRLQIIQNCHDTVLTEHSGQVRTFDFLDRWYYLKVMQMDINQYVHNWNSRPLSHSSSHLTFGVLQPLSLPKMLWEVISTDFLV